MYLEPVESPATELEPAGLLVEWKISDVDITGGFKYGGRFPFHQPVMVEGSLRHGGNMVVTICTVNTHCVKRDYSSCKIGV